jgi:hypothetical protein
MSSSARYPSQFEMFRLEALGDPPFLSIGDARDRYDSGKSLRVLPEADPPQWYLLVAPKHHRFTITFYTPTGTPLRTATWEKEGDQLLRRRVIDLFYPDGDPGRTLPTSEVVSVTQDVSADGVVAVTLSSPFGDDDYRETSEVSLDDVHAPIPNFGEWQALVSASAPTASDRFGIDAIDAAVAHADRSLPFQGSGDGSTIPNQKGWRIAVGEREILHAVDGIIEGGRVAEDIPVLDRGDAKVLPLATQHTGRNAVEERRRMDALASDLADALEQREGRGIRVDLESRGADSVGSYAAALRAAGATEALWWEYEQTHGAVLVWSGDESAGTLKLALHMVPVSWVSERRSVPAVDGIDVHWSPADIGASES